MAPRKGSEVSLNRRRGGDGLSARFPRSFESRVASQRRPLDRERLRSARSSKPLGKDWHDKISRYAKFCRRRATLAGALFTRGARCPRAALPATQPASFLDGIHRQTSLTSTVPDNGDQNPVCDRRRAGLRRNDPEGRCARHQFQRRRQSAGDSARPSSTTIRRPRSSRPSRALPRNLAGCPGGVGLSTAMAVLKSGWVIVGSAPSADGTTGTKGAGCLIVLDCQRQGRRASSPATRSTCRGATWR